MLKKHQGSIETESAVHFKLYKSGKTWVVGGIAVLSLYAGFALSPSIAHADVATDQTPVATTQATSATTSDKSATLSAPATATKKVTDTALPTQSVATATTAAAKPVAQTTVAPVPAAAKAVTTATTDESQSLVSNIKDSVFLPYSKIRNAHVSFSNPGPFLAGVNAVIPFKAFGGDGMLTRLLLKSSDTAPWSDDGTANNPALLPIASGADQYSYEVDLNNPNLRSLTGFNLAASLSAITSGYTSATVKIYKNDDLKTIVASKEVNIYIGDIAKNIKPEITVPASYLEQAINGAPFTAGVNQIIPFTAFGGDGMLTRLLLKASETAPWSNNGTAKNATLAPLTIDQYTFLPIANTTLDQYEYEVDLNGNTVGKTGADLLAQLKANGTTTYNATLKIYDKSDLTKAVVQEDLTIHLQGVTNNLLDNVTVPAGYLANAQYPGPFTAGVNEVIPFKAFGGDGMLTRLILKAAAKAPWSDNGSAKNAGLLPITTDSDQYAYEVDLDGNTVGKKDGALLDQLKANGTHTYHATVKVYGLKDGQADLTNLIGTKEVTITLNGATPSNNTNIGTGVVTTPTKPGTTQTPTTTPTTTSGTTDQGGTDGKTTGKQRQTTSGTTHQISAGQTTQQSTPTKLNLSASTDHQATANHGVQSGRLPQTGAANENGLAVIGAAIAGGLLAIGGALGFKKRQ